MGARILIVQDDEHSLELTSFLLEAFGHLPVEARTVQQALEHVGRQAVDLVLLDLGTLEADGVETVATMRARPELSSTPIVALTPLATAGRGGGGRAGGFDGSIVETITPEGFAAQIDEFLPVGLRSSVRPRSPHRANAA